MEDKLFADLLQSAREMVAIEKGELSLNDFKTKEIAVPDIKDLRQNLNLKQEELALAVGVSTSLVQSWEIKKSFPTGAALKILRLLEQDASFLKKLQAL